MKYHSNLQHKGQPLPQQFVNLGQVVKEYNYGTDVTVTVYQSAAHVYYAPVGEQRYYSDKNAAFSWARERFNHIRGIN